MKEFILDVVTGHTQERESTIPPFEEVERSKPIQEQINELKLMLLKQGGIL
ncbi:hypothetical protein R9X47_18190 [Wukongibacter baidiensis]|uniref:hypothetical protein n=1 Tax=Wukongibacter baidiensis TaxID=1723361 RepID=UPI003D7F4B54